MENNMSSRVLSRFLPVAEGDVSIYESMRRDGSRRPDIEAQRLPPPPAGETFQDDDENPDETFMYNPDEDQLSPLNPMLSPKARLLMESPLSPASRPRQGDRRVSKRVDDDDDVPASLMLDARARSVGKQPSRPVDEDRRQARAEAQWKAVQQQDTHQPRVSRPPRPGSGPGPGPGPGRSRAAAPSSNPPRPNPSADATWLFTNASNLDAFLLEIYQYYVSNGVWSILLSRVLSLLTEGFVFSFATFLTTCIDYSKIPTSKSTPEILVPQCMATASWFRTIVIFAFTLYWLARLAHYMRDTRRLFRMHDFYLHVLGISDQDIQTVSWVKVVEGLVRVQNANVVTATTAAASRKYLNYKEPQQRLSAESIANRLMRQANYYVALYNKEILDFTLPLPFVGTRQFYSKSLEWGIDFCLTNFIFDEKGSIRPFCLEVRNRAVLVAALKTRLRVAAMTSIFFAPFNILRFCIMYFFRYYTEFTRNPSRVSNRTFTPFAEWKIREFNELEHLFQRRLRQAYPFANEYLKQFPKDKTDQICRFVAFVSGAIAAVLALATLFDPELFLGFEVTPGRTAVFWLTIMVGIFGGAHGALPDDNEVHDPVLHLKEVLMYIHYMPAHWRQRLHSNEVRAEFSALYQTKVLIFVEEILSLIVAPWILWRNSEQRCERIIDFFREQTVHVDGIGYQCNFAVFGFKKDLNAEDPLTVLNEPDGLRDEYYGLKDDKMAASVHGFMHYYSHYKHPRPPNGRRPLNWHPPPAWPSVIPGGTAEIPSSRKEDAQHPLSSRSQAMRTTTIPSHPDSSRPSRRTANTNNTHPQSTASVIHHDPRSAPSPNRHRLSSSPAPSPQPNPPKTPSSSDHHAPRTTASNLMAEDSDLREFADAPTFPGSQDSDALLRASGPDGNGVQGVSKAEADAEEAANAGGVLGMLYQFSKAQQDLKSGGGVEI